MFNFLISFRQNSFSLIYSFIICLSLTTIFDAFFKGAIAGSCAITNVVSTAFGAYDIFNTSPTVAVGSLTYRCVDLGGGLITIDLSKGASTTYNPRTLKNGNDTLNYNLYLDSGHNIIWGDGTEGSSRYGPISTLNDSDMIVSIYGKIPAQQTSAKVGNYSDTIVITLSF